MSATETERRPDSYALGHTPQEYERLATHGQRVRRHAGTFP